MKKSMSGMPIKEKPYVYVKLGGKTLTMPAEGDPFFFTLTVGSQAGATGYINSLNFRLKEGELRRLELA